MNPTNQASGIPTFRAGEMEQVIREFLIFGLPLLITGMPGVGKTALVDFVRRFLGYDLILTHPVTCEPTDIKGIPVMNFEQGICKFAPIGDLKQALEATKPTLWLFDDFQHGDESMQKATMNFFHGRRVGEFKLPDNVRLMATTNDRRHRAGASNMIAPMASRFTSIIEMLVDAPGWLKWAAKSGIFPLVPAFIDQFPDALLDAQQTTDATGLVQSTSPRTWEHVSQIEQTNLPESLKAKVIQGAIGPVYAHKYTTFKDLWLKRIDVSNILTNPKGAAIPAKLDELYATATVLSCRADAGTIKAIGIYLLRLLEAGKGEFSALTLGSAVKRNDSLLATSEYVALQTGPLGDLMRGKAIA